MPIKLYGFQYFSLFGANGYRLGNVFVSAHVNGVGGQLSPATRRLSTMLRTDRESVFLNKLSFRGAVRFLLLLVLTASGTILCAQIVTIKLVNGRNGNPISNSHVNVWVGTKRKEAMVIPTDKDGIARLRLTDNDDEVDLHMRNKYAGDNVVVDPIVKYDENFQVNVPFVICYPHVRDYSWLSTTNISTKQLLQEGIVWPNSCSKATASPTPGELIIFVRPLTWWEKLKQ